MSDDSLIPSEPPRTPLSTLKRAVIYGSLLLSTVIVLVFVGWDRDHAKEIPESITFGLGFVEPGRPVASEATRDGLGRGNLEIRIDKPRTYGLFALSPGDAAPRRILGPVRAEKAGRIRLPVPEEVGPAVEKICLLAIESESEFQKAESQLNAAWLILTKPQCVRVH